jgi:AraC-like DNA-binding protein
MPSLQLLRSGLPVAEVALAVGYDSLSSYLKLFKKLTGLSTRSFLAQERLDVRNADPAENPLSSEPKPSRRTRINSSFSC